MSAGSAALSPNDYYDDVARRCSAESARAERAARVATWIRLGLAAAAIALLLRDGARWAGVVVAGGFVAAAWWHRRTRMRADAAHRRADAARAGLARASRDWSAMPAPRPLAAALAPDGWPARLARDLDVTGARGLTRLLDVGHAAVGAPRLLDWLLGDPPPLDVIRDRQASVAHLRGTPALLLDVAAEARHGGAPATAQGFGEVRAWCAAPPDEDRSLPAARVVSALCVVALAGALVVMGWEAALRLAPLLLVQITLTARARRRLQRELRRVDLALPQIAGVARVLSLVTAAGDAPGALGTLQRRLRAEHAVAALARLARLLDWNATRHSPMAHWALNAAVGFDVHLAHAFARWRRACGARAVAWLDLAADAEALVALATLAFEHPRWAMAEVHDGPATPLDAAGLAHPLLAPDLAVPNDVRLGAPGEVAVLSGANMAGKTTFLRAVGLNALLAQAGGPVCAESLTLRRCRVRSSVRVEDDLSRGASLFLAEATRLRDVIVDAESESRPPVLFLFDEILHGTNAADRRAATRTVLRRLARAGAAGLVTTHDPEVGVYGDGGSARQLHFAGRVARDPSGRPALAFDYRVRAGPAREANAGAVLEMLGISD